MEVQIPWLGVVLAAVSAMVIGSLWYSKAVFGAKWQKMIGLSNDRMAKEGPKALSMLVVVSFVTAFVLAHFINYAHAYNQGTWMSDSFQTALWVWLGFGLTTILAHGVFEPRDRTVMVINAGNRLVTLVVMALILGAFFK